MHRSKSLVLSLGLALVGGTAWFARGVRAADPVASPGRVAVADVFDLMSASPRKRAIEAQRREQQRAVETYKQEQIQKLRDLGGDIEKTPKADPKRMKLEEDYARQGSLSEFELKWRAKEADTAYSDALENLYAEIKGYIREVAQQNGYSLVLFKSDDPLNLDKPGEFVLSVAMRPVLYYDRAIDITALVKARVEATKPAGGVPPAGPAPVPTAPAPSGPVAPPSVPPAGMR